MISRHSNKKGAMQMSVGTIVTIVLLMSVLVLGIFLVQKIFSTGTNAIDQVDDQVQQQISELFEDGDDKIVTFPQSRKVKIAKGESGGFAFAISNQDRDKQQKTFKYETSVAEIGDNCGLNEDQALSLINLGKSQDGITISSGSRMEQPIFVEFSTSEQTPLCSIRYRIDVEYSDGQFYESAEKDVKIVSGGGLF